MATNHIKCKAPNKLDRFFISRANGGLSPNQRINERDGYVVPNCTGYANGWFSKEAYQLNANEENCYDYFRFEAQNFWWQVTDPAGHYYGKFETSKDPVEGGMMVWSDSVKHNGHVAIVDSVNADGTVTVANSAAGGKEYETETLSNKNGRWGYGGAYSYLGCIHNPGVHEVFLPEVQDRDTTHNQVSIRKPTLRVRVYPSLKDSVIGLAKVGFYNFEATTERDGYTWYEIGENQWVAGVEGTLIPLFKVGSMVCLKSTAKVKITYRSFAYERAWTVEKYYGDRVLISCEDGKRRLNVEAKDLLPVMEQ